MFVVITIIGILASILIPNIAPAVEFIEVLIAEKNLLKAVKECQIGLINNEISPQYTLPENNVRLGIFTKNKFILSHSGIPGECSPEYGGNQLRFSRFDYNTQNIIYSLIINVSSGEKSSEGSLPTWLDWWNGKSSSLIPENDSFFNDNY